MASETASVRVERRVLEALDFYVPRDLQGNHNASAKVHFVLVKLLHTKGALLDVPEVRKTWYERYQRRAAASQKRRAHA